MKQVVFLPFATKQMKSLKRQRMTIYIKQIWLLIEDIDENGDMNGIGSPERLYKDKEFLGWFSRKIEINGQDTFNRLVYNSNSEQIFIKECIGHYGSKIKQIK